MFESEEEEGRLRQFDLKRKNMNWFLNLNPYG